METSNYQDGQYDTHEQQQNNTESLSPIDSSWCISVKTVGGGFEDCIPSSDDDQTNRNTRTATTTTITSSGERIFHISVDPEDGVTSLYQEIEDVTGVKPSQQRLIYRGRIINDHSNKTSSKSESNRNKRLDNNASNGDIKNDPAASSSSATLDVNDRDESDGLPKIKDIAGLCDGQTIHLVRKRETPNNTTGVTNGGTASESSQHRSSTTDMSTSSGIESDILNGSTGNGSGGGALLAALLGLGSNSREDEDGRNGGTTATAAAQSPSPSSWRSSRSRSHRRPPYRLSAADLEVPDPGSMEPVRQGLMTLHTLLPHLQLHSEENTSPLEANREWFRGQWIDCRDTVNQWLEATVVEILLPEDVLPNLISQTNSSQGNVALYPERRKRAAQVDHDPAVSANDLEGRRRLLLEPCEPGDPQELSGDLVGYRPRSNNEGAQILLIHYNGWPQRWDEWIRSDSERIRPFRTRTRHSNVSSTASPTPQSVFSDAPRTNISGGDEAMDRNALLPELHRALLQVNSLLGQLVEREQQDDDGLEDLHNSGLGIENGQRRAHTDLPWMARDGELGNNDSTNCDDDCNDEIPDSQPRFSNIEESSDEEESVDGDQNGTSTTNENQTTFGPAPRPVYSQRELRSLATVLDRLGRTLTDAAPHVASLAASLPGEAPPTTSTSSLPGDNSSHSSRRGSLSDFGSSSAPLGGLLSLWSRERRRQLNVDDNSAAHQASTNSLSVDPDHVDYASGVVNTSRGEVRNGPQSRSSQDDVANLLGAYLAAASLGGLASSDDENTEETGTGLGRLLARGGSGGSGGGIDIHIHAVVTTGGAGGGAGIMGIGTGGFGGAGSPIATLGGGAVSPTATLGGTRNLFSSSRGGSRSGGSILRSRSSVSPTTIIPDIENDNDDLFSELYSENPSPADPYGSAGPDENLSSVGSPIRIRGTAAEINPQVSFEDDPLRSYDGSSTRSTPQSSPRRQSSERRNGMFRLFRRRSRSNHNDSSR